MLWFFFTMNSIRCKATNKFFKLSSAKLLTNIGLQRILVRFFLFFFLFSHFDIENNKRPVASCRSSDIISVAPFFEAKSWIVSTQKKNVEQK